MKKPSEGENTWDDLRNQIIGLGNESHGKNYYSLFKQSRDALIRFRSVIEEIPDMILIVDEHDRILDMNKIALNVFDKERHELISSDLKEFQNIPYLLMKDKGSEEKVLLYENHKVGKIIRELELRPILLGNRIFRVLIGRDVTNRVKAEENLLKLNESLEIMVQERTASIEEQMRVLRETQDQLIISEKMALLGTLVAGVAHEINTPLGVGITASSSLVSESEILLKLVQENSLTHSRFEDFLDYLNQSAMLIQSNLERAGDLIQSFKQVAVDQSSEISRKINLKSYLSEVIHSLYPQWKKHRVTLEGGLEDDILTYPGDWSQILTNLIINSVSHGFRSIVSGGMILIRVYEENSMIVLDYRDNGCGLTREQTERVFEPFYTTARNKGGTGLGMNIVYNLVTLKMKGSIVCLHKEVPGAAFHIRVPRFQEKTDPE